MSTKVYNDYDFLNVSRILNLPDGTLPQHPVTVAQLNAAIEGLAPKDSVRVASTANINLASPGATIDGITLSAGDRVLVKDQTTASQNGLYVFNGAAVAMTRALDASTSNELEAAVAVVEEGTSAGAAFRQTTVNFVLDTGNVAWTPFGTAAPAATESLSGTLEIATQAETDTGTDDVRAITPLKLANWSGRKRKLAQAVGDGSALSYNVTHNFNTRDVVVQVYRNSTPWDTIGCDVERPDANTVTLRFTVAPTANQFVCDVLA